ncbi:hypothetical protein B7494_g8124 [Chlorociboria aeruginascens]|nr:hypothetical protein B7494_g8124 [Chlorociboria aeruginascens]
MESSKQKKRKVTPLIFQSIIDELRAVNITFQSAPAGLATELISSLKPGIGLLGNEEEEKAYYEEYLKNQSKESTNGQHDSTEIGSVDSSHREDDKTGEGPNDQAEDETPLQVYKEKRKKNPDDDPDAEQELGDYEKLTFGQDYVEIDGEQYHARDVFGAKWVDRIQAAEMAFPLHDYQLKGAAQLHHLCLSSSGGGILADAMGLGKTNTAIAAMWMVKNRPGFSLVVCPKSLCIQWVDAVENAFQPGCGMRAYHLDSSSITAHELFAMGVDVVVCSYNQVAASERARKYLLDELDAYNNNKTEVSKKPRRPDAVLHSDFWRELNLPIKRLVLDEAQVVNKQHGVFHQAIKSLFYESAIILTGTPGHNHYHGFSGLVSFLKGHPFTNHTLFMKAFSSIGYDGKVGRPDLTRVRFLQRFLQGITIARPADTLKLPLCHLYRSSFNIRPDVETTITYMFNRYAKLQQIRSKEAKYTHTGISDDPVALSYIIQAQMLSLHPALTPADAHSSADPDYVGDQEAFVYGYINDDPEAQGGEKRDKWLGRLQKMTTDELIKPSDRLLRFIAVYSQIRKTNPLQRIVVFSQYLKFLDIIAEALSRLFKVNALRYDGTVKHHSRRRVESEFRDCHPSRPMLLTATAGSTGLNITAASVMIQTEVWWNKNTEIQAMKRLHRQLQTSEVMVIQLFAINSPVDSEMLKVQTIKATINSEIMEAVYRHHDEGPDIRELIFRKSFAPPQYEEFDGI